MNRRWEELQFRVGTCCIGACLRKGSLPSEPAFTTSVELQKTTYTFESPLSRFLVPDNSVEGSGIRFISAEERQHAHLLVVPCHAVCHNVPTLITDSHNLNILTSVRSNNSTEVRIRSWSTQSLVIRSLKLHQISNAAPLPFFYVESWCYRANYESKPTAEADQLLLRSAQTGSSLLQ